MGRRSLLVLHHAAVEIELPLIVGLCVSLKAGISSDPHKISRSAWRSTTSLGSTLLGASSSVRVGGVAAMARVPIEVLSRC